ncbi:hypothetical protein [Mycobacterium sp.]|uniref:hypothetical protein n=1 Tax=Mycobacterium sp. TaxID=1785 RepID=UPI0031D75A44
MWHHDTERRDAIAPSGNGHSSARPLETRVDFHFRVIYFGLFCLLYVQIMFVLTGILGWLLPRGAFALQINVLGPVAEWVGRHMFGDDESTGLGFRAGGLRNLGSSA